MSGSWWNEKWNAMWEEEYMHISGSWGNMSPVINLPMQFMGERGSEVFYNKPVEIQRISDREFCEYCHGNTKQDARGNCVACGAPKRGYPVLLMR